jgi:hypothetical protein
MGRLEIQIRHGGHDPRPSGAVIALAVLVVLAVVGGAGRHVIDGIAHTVTVVAEIAAFTVGTLAAGALAVVIVLAAARARRALANRPRPVRVQSVRVADAVTVHPLDDDPADLDRPALDPARRRPSGWPLSGRWAELPLDDRGDDPRRYS